MGDYIYLKENTVKVLLKYKVLYIVFKPMTLLRLTNLQVDYKLRGRPNVIPEF
jgi:hypothetical protein